MPSRHFREMDQLTDSLARLRVDILSPSVRGGVEYWIGLLRGRRFPARTDLDPAAMLGQLDQLSLLDVSRNPLTFRLRLLGQITRDRQGVAAGADISDVGDEQGRERILTRLRLCLEERQPIRGIYRYALLNSPGKWLWAEAVSCPLSNDGNAISHIVSFGSDFDSQPPRGLQEWP
jgi:hypothetical protein